MRPAPAVLRAAQDRPGGWPDMGHLVKRKGWLVVPYGGKQIQDNFVDFLWDMELSVFLVKNKWVGQPESEQTGLGLRIAPGIY